MREYEIELEIFEGKGAMIERDSVPNIVEEGICAWMLGDEEEPEKKVDCHG